MALSSLSCVIASMPAAITDFLRFCRATSSLGTSAVADVEAAVGRSDVEAAVGRSGGDGGACGSTTGLGAPAIRGGGGASADGGANGSSIVGEAETVGEAEAVATSDAVDGVPRGGSDGIGDALPSSSASSKDGRARWCSMARVVPLVGVAEPSADAGTAPSGQPIGETAASAEASVISSFGRMDGKIGRA